MIDQGCTNALFCCHSPVYPDSEKTEEDNLQHIKSVSDHNLKPINKIAAPQRALITETITEVSEVHSDASDLTQLASYIGNKANFNTKDIDDALR